MSASHVRGKSHGERERTDEHPDDLDRDEDHVDERAETVWHQVLPVLDEPVGLGTRDDDRPKVTVASATVTLKLAVAVVPPCSKCLTNESSPV